MNASASSAAHPMHPLVERAEQMAKEGVNFSRLAFFLGLDIDRYTDGFGRVTPELQEAFYEIEARHIRGRPLDVVQAFQWLVGQTGGKVRDPLVLPANDLPIWHHYLNEEPGPELRKKLLRGQTASEAWQQFPFSEIHFPHPNPPAQVDVLIIGGGLSGAKVAYDLSGDVEAGRRSVAIIDSGLEKAASFRNGGLIESKPENFLGTYEGLLNERAKYIRLTRPYLVESKVQALAQEQTEWIYRWGKANFEQVMKASREGIRSLAMMNGWTRQAMNKKEEQALREEAQEGKKLGLHFEFMEADRFSQEFNVRSEFGAIVSVDSGAYHPGRYVTGLLKRVMERGVELHTHTQATSLQRDPNGGWIVETSHGTIRAQKVVVMTNAWTRELLPELGRHVAPFQSHVGDWTHVALPSNSRYWWGGFTSHFGDSYGRPLSETTYVDSVDTARVTYHVGGGVDTPVENLQHLDRNLGVLNTISKTLADRFPGTAGQPPIVFSTGWMAFSPDRIPFIGLLEPDLYVQVSSGGYGGFWTQEGAALIAEHIRTGKWGELYREEFLSPQRFLNGTALNPIGRAFSNDHTCATLLGNIKRGE